MTSIALAYVESPSTVDPDRPLIYKWEIRDRDGQLLHCYVGKASGGASRPRLAYANNVRRLRVGQPWHGQPSRGYRQIHHRLSEAVDAGHHVTLPLLCNIEEGQDINEVERRVRAEHGCEGR
ncbi:hypothetical protein BH23CHL7_BH23CHL7_05740 [soil metagenome]